MEKYEIVIKLLTQKIHGIPNQHLCEQQKSKLTRMTFGFTQRVSNMW